MRKQRVGPSEGDRILLWPSCALAPLKRRGSKNLILTAALSGMQGWFNTPISKRKKVKPPALGPPL